MIHSKFEKKVKTEKVIRLSMIQVYNLVSITMTTQAFLNSLTEEIHASVES